MSLFDPEFYPTPKEIIARMVAPYADRISKACILEPSAGNGAILHFLDEGVPFTYTTKRGQTIESTVKPDPNRVYAAEHNPELQMILHEKGYRLVAEDFLTYKPDIRYDLIIMNPPFKTGEKHLLHAWEIIPSGDIVCLLNAETIHNPYTETRKLLARIIAENGTVEELGRCFSTADNPTDVEVIMVRLHKEAKDDPFRLDFTGLSKEETPDFSQMAVEGGALTQESRLDAFIRAWNKAKETAVEYIKARQTLRMFTDVFRCNDYEHTDPIGDLDKYLANSRNSYKSNDVSAFMTDGYNHFVTTATKIAWGTIFNQIGLGKYMTSGLRDALNKFQQEQSSLSITKENINKLFQFIMLNVSEIMDHSVVEIYDKFTSYYPGNTSYKEGWKTNKQFSCNRKVILPDVADAGYMPQRYGYDRFFRPNYYHNLDDIDKAMCWLSGTNFDELRGEIDIPGQGKTACPARSTIEQTLRRIPVGSTEWHESAFFRVKAFKKGTIHIEFKDEALWAKFNLTVNKGKKKLGMAE